MSRKQVVFKSLNSRQARSLSESQMSSISEHDSDGYASSIRWTNELQPASKHDNHKSTDDFPVSKELQAIAIRLGIRSK